MPLHPEVARVVVTMPAPPDELDPVAMRADQEAHVPPLDERLPLAAVQDATAGDVPVRIYTPTGADGWLVYIHGGAFFLGSLDTHDHVARSLAEATGATVVSVGYRLAPEAPYPAGLDDCYAVVRWMAEHGRTMAIAGDSSGANFVAAVAAMAHDDDLDAITDQILYYPSLDLDFDPDRYASLRENAVGYGLETVGLKPFNAFYVDSGADPADPLVSPIKRADLTGLPRALVVTAEYDPMRDEGELYARRLSEAGVDVVLSRYAGAGHGFVEHFSWIPEFHRVFEETRDFLDRTSTP
ncbi:alpha/beta hydrolase [Capillimicrobium parvum]|uniref:Carboxylesterase NlhH n=1 Tax=Capillimicrobium parvum TaxID=2884022 RepID=A0A9E6XY62_9ACTN|nr:alpha/beta hydrolase [Capillimicrobium parvum]UGS36677.1 Carboxylesterase NlhH [Capillimicrobium parvum]